MNHNIIIVIATKLMIPFIILFGLYVQFHGDFGPGGGFQAGVIVAVGFILYGMIFGIKQLEKVVSFDYLRVLSGFGVLIYGGTGVFTLMKGGYFLDYNKLASNPIHGQHYGIFAIELGVGMTVASVMIMIYLLFSHRTRSQHFKNTNINALQKVNNIHRDQD